jgi:eukaryotic-like serine/threonine-protein kinase
MTEVETGRRIAERFVLSSPLGGGSNGSVWQATDEREGREVALKFLWPEVASLEEARLRFEREARALSGLRHPHIIEVIEFGADAELLYLAMELLEGSTLDAMIEAGPLDPARALEIADQLLAGLAFAHQLGVAHRDVKSENVFVAERSGERPRAKLLDFGLAKFRDRASWGATETLTVTGTLLGTPGYMPPEQAFGGAVDARSDVYSAGVVLYELLTGHWPYYGEELTDLLRAHAMAPIPRIRDARPELRVRPELDAVIQKALAKRPQERFEDAGAMRAALRQVPAPAAFAL